MIQKYIEVLQKYAKKENIRNYIQSIVVSLIYFFTFFFIIFGISFIDIPLVLLFYITLSFKILLIMIILFIVWKAFSKPITILEVALKLDKEYNNESDLFLNGAEFFLKNQKNAFIDEIDKSANKKIINCKYNISYKKNVYSLLILLLLIVSFVLVYLTPYFHDCWNLFYNHKLPDQKYNEKIDVSPGNINIAKNEDLNIVVLNPDKTEYSLYVKRDKLWKNEQLIDNKKLFPNIDYSFSYFIKNKYVTSDTFKIQVFEKPIVKNIKIKKISPIYMNKKNEFIENSSGNLKGYEGTKFNIEINANNYIDSAFIFVNNDKITMNRMGKTNFNVSISPLKKSTYYFEIYDFLKRKNSKIDYTIDIIKDKKPEINIIYPAVDTLINKNKIQPLRIIANDDFLLKKLNLVYHYENQKKLIIKEISNDIGRNIIDLDYYLNLSKENLYPGDTIIYWATISDNYPRKHITKSKKYKLIMPSIEEILDNLEEKEKNQQSKINELIENQQKLKNDLIKKKLELLKKDNLNWNDKKELEDIIKQQENQNKEMELLAKAYEKLIDEFNKNKTLSDETLEKMKKINEMMNDISNEQIKDAIKNLQEKLSQMDTNDVKNALNKFEFSMEEYSKKLDRTMEMLKQIKKELSLQKALKILSELKELQNKIEKDNNENKNIKGITSEQNSLMKKNEHLNNQLKEFKNLLDKNKENKLIEQTEELKALLDSLNTNMNETLQQLQNKNRQNSSQKMQKSNEMMNKMKQRMMSMQQQLSNKNINNIMEAIIKTSKEIALLSLLHQKSKDNYTNDPFLILNNEITVYEGMQKSINNLFKTPQIFMMISPKLIIDINDTYNNFRTLFTDINNANNYKIKNSLSKIQINLNTVVYDLLNNMNQSQQSGSNGGSPMQQMMQQMQQMGQQQMMMNQLTQKLMQQMGEQQKMGERHKFSKEGRNLGDDEQRIADNLKRMLQTNKEAQKQAHSIDEMIKNLENISKKLRSGIVNNDLIEKQKRILSRMLEVQKSIHKRDKSKKRRAESAENKIWDVYDETNMDFESLKRNALIDKDKLNLTPELKKWYDDYLKLLNELEKNNNEKN